MKIALKCKTHSSDTQCPTPVVSTYSGPSSARTAETEARLSVGNTPALSALPVVRLPSPEASLGGQKYHIGGIHESKRPLSCGLVHKKHGLDFNQGKRERAMDPNAPLQKCAGASKRHRELARGCWRRGKRGLSGFKR